MENLINVGKTGENKACEYLENKGYRIIDRNYREKFGEIDIIAVSRDLTLVFVEVKTIDKSGKSAIHLPDGQIAGLEPEDNLTKSKLMKLKRICQMFSAKHPELIDEKRGWRIDLLALTKLDKDYVINHYKNISL